ncbi:M20 family metallopeptidase [Aureimonas altamirensis]|uniref:M20 aminoacylase family protein n=1 Tax=Aureimonas altamirensis TaxID=370622 RepID=UPI002036CA28|nr:M20 aminoacylase family protein [Aureimonas altamirensis]MCM2504305.1 M20 family metallopeptidase [Aureimonas altamirensis]
MTVLPRIQEFAADLERIRHDLHAHPEIGFEEHRTSDIVAAELERMGAQVHRGIGRTGVVGLIAGKHSGTGSIGLRADMDALPMDEETNLTYRSTTPGRFHGCGHDGHTTMLLGAARYLAETRDFAGTAVCIFQPAEEGLGGARAMLADKLFERFPCDEIYGLHNAPQLALGEVAIFPGRAMAGASFFDIHIRARGAHGAQPHNARDAVLIATMLAQNLQSIVSRNVTPMEPAVLSITRIESGSAYNVIPAEARMSGTMRFFDRSIGELMAQRMRQIAAGMAQGFEVEIDVDVRDIFTVLENAPAPTAYLTEVAEEIVGADGVLREPKPVTGSEDFADMLLAVPGAYCWVGHGGDVPVHNPGFVLDDAILPIGSSLLARIVEKRLAA